MLILRATTIAAWVLMGLTAPAMAQETTTGEANAEAAETESPVAPTTYIGAQHGDWAVRCEQTEDGPDPCTLHQFLADQGGTRVAEIQVVELDPGQEFVTGVSITTPLETLLTRQVTVAVDGGVDKRYQFQFCDRVGCHAEIGFLQEDLDAFKRGQTAQVTIYPRAVPDLAVNLTVSLSGFTAGYQALIDQSDPG